MDYQTELLATHHRTMADADLDAVWRREARAQRRQGRQGRHGRRRIAARLRNREN